MRNSRLFTGEAMRKLVSVLDYILEKYDESFMDAVNNENFDLTSYDIDLINDWYNNKIEISDRIKAIFLKLESKHTYAAALCLFFSINNSHKG